MSADCRMSALLLSSLALFALCARSYAFLNGFSRERCDDMDPTLFDLEKASEGFLDTDLNSTEFDAEDSRPPSSIHLSGSLNLYRIVTSSPKYRRGRTLEITIRGPEFNAFMLQVRKIGPDERRGHDQAVRVGEFVRWPASLQPMFCDGTSAPTSLTNRNYASKSGITVTWRAPTEDVGDVHIVARFVAGEEYWQLTESREISLSEFPVNLKSCGKAKSCVLYSEKSASCHEDNCDYILTYSVLNSTSIHFVLGGSAKSDHSYLAVGFSKSSEAETLQIIACTKAKTVAEIKFFVKHEHEGLVEHAMNLESKKLDLDGGRMWCSFVAPMITLSEEGTGLDLSLPLYHFYLHGNTNYNKSANVPVLPAKLRKSKKDIRIDKIEFQYLTMEKSKRSSAASYSGLVCTLVSLLLVLMQRRIQ